MPKVEIVQTFRYAPDGNNVITVEPGGFVEGEWAEAALQMGCGRPVREGEEMRHAVIEERETAVRKPRRQVR